MKQLVTKWGRDLDKARPLAEYPRPQLKRESYQSLNGEWDFELSKSSDVSEYSQKIIVPFAPESYLSGLMVSVQPDDYMHYRKYFVMGKGFNQGRVLLNFEAVDQECVVWLNGHYVGAHVGGYLSFSFDISAFLQEGRNELRLLAKDFTEFQPHARGKQKLKRQGKMKSLFYTPTSGIWQSVWLESVPLNYVTGLELKPNFNQGRVAVKVKTNRDSNELAQIIIQDQDGQRFSRQLLTNGVQQLVLDEVKAWSPDKPHLYSVTVIYQQDVVESYFAMRDLSVVVDQSGVRRFALNHQPIFLSGVLDQGYWPDGGLTAPDDEALMFDISQLKAMGFNTIRKHIKLESARFYYHCDRLGMMVVQDMPNGGAPNYPMWLVTYLANASKWFNRHMRDDQYKLLGRDSQAGREQFQLDLAGMIEQLGHFPSIVAWVPFNEGWGQFDAAEIGRKVQAADPSRWLIETSGWFDQGGGDAYSIHNYLFKLKVQPQDRVVALTEYGGYALALEGHLSADKAFGYQHYKTPEILTANYERLWLEEILPNIPKGLSMAIYTQVSDVEEEINGVFTYDREVRKLDGETVKRLNEKAYEEMGKI